MSLNAWSTISQIKSCWICIVALFQCAYLGIAHVTVAALLFPVTSPKSEFAKVA